MINRYTTEEMQDVWSDNTKYGLWMKLEKEIAHNQALNGVITQEAADDISTTVVFLSKSEEVFDNFIDHCRRQEQKTKHDFVAFLEVLESHMDPNHSGYLHHELTSSDVIDTAFSIQCERAIGLITEEVIYLIDTLNYLKTEFGQLPIWARTHGQPATLILWEDRLNTYIQVLEDMNRFLIEIHYKKLVGKISGPVGLKPLINSVCVEENVVGEFNLRAQRSGSTQIVHRHNYSRILYSLAEIMAFLDKMSQDFRIQSITGEISMSKDGAGSSSMPHKVNPVVFENISGLSRMVQAALPLGVSNIVTWFERDISHSSVERVVFPDAFNLTHYALNSLSKFLPKVVLKASEWHPDCLDSHAVLTKLSTKMPRNKAHAMVRKADLKDFKEWLTEKELDECANVTLIQRRIK